MRSPAPQAGIFPSALKYFQQVRKPPGDRKTTDDLAPQLAEFDLRCQAQDFNTAVRVVFEFDFNHLYLWGYYRLMAELHERVQGKLTDPLANENSIGMLGHASYRMGQYQEAIAHFGEALEHAGSREDRYRESVRFCNLGIC
jgi:tetratricopeptide (TPR) repeat protein